MFQIKNYEVFKKLPKVFRIASDILGLGYHDNGRDQDITLKRILQYEET